MADMHFVDVEVKLEQNLDDDEHNVDPLNTDIKDEFSELKQEELDIGVDEEICGTVPESVGEKCASNPGSDSENGNFKVVKPGSCNYIDSLPSAVKSKYTIIAIDYSETQKPLLGFKDYRYNYCMLCQATVKCALNYHMLNVHQGTHEKSICSACGESFNSKLDLQNHMVVHKNPEKFTCTVCRKLMSSTISLRNHMEKHIDTTIKFRCTQCKEMFEDKTYAEYHYILHRGKYKNRYPCLECNKSCYALGTLDSHMRKIHFKNKKCINTPEATTARILNSVLLDDGFLFTSDFLSSLATDFLLNSTSNDEDPTHVTRNDGLVINVDQTVTTLCNDGVVICNDLNSETVATDNILSGTDKANVKSGTDLKYFEDDGTNEFVLNDKVVETVDDEVSEDVKFGVSSDNQLTYFVSTLQPNFSSSFDEDAGGNVDTVIDSVVGNCSGSASENEVMLNRIDGSSGDNYNATAGSKNVCEKCDLMFTRKSNLMTHLKTKKHKRTNFTCSICENEFSTPSAIRSHSTSHKENEEYLCPLCKGKFPTKPGLDEHLETHLEEKNKITCRVCGKVSMSRKANYIHMMSHNEPEAHQCNICYKGFRSKFYLQIHIKQVHCKKKNLMCYICSKMFIWKSSLEKHIIAHLQQTVDRPTCHICQKSYRARATLTVHINNKHTQEKRFNCEICNKVFFAKQYLITHMNSHTKSKKFSCSLCDDKFTQKHSLNTHLERIHKKVRTKPVTRFL